MEGGEDPHLVLVFICLPDRLSQMCWGQGSGDFLPLPRSMLTQAFPKAGPQAPLAPRLAGCPLCIHWSLEAPHIARTETMECGRPLGPSCLLCQEVLLLHTHPQGLGCS